MYTLSRSFTFVARNAEGACLAMTSPASMDSLTDACCQAVGDFIKQSADGLYSFARAQGLQDSPLYFVTSCINSRSWGMASFINAQQRSTMKLEPVSSPSNPNQQAYRWTETKQFGRCCVSGPGGAPRFQDQPLFLNGWKLAISERYQNAWPPKSNAVPGGAHNPGLEGGEGLSRQDLVRSLLETLKVWLFSWLVHFVSYPCSCITDKPSIGLPQQDDVLRGKSIPLPSCCCVDAAHSTNQSTLSLTTTIGSSP
jgi:hypothetical protein